MVHAIRVHETGGPDVMKWEEVEVGAPGAGEARVRHTAIGLNFIDTYFRSGLYPAPAGTPFTPGNEGAGVVTAVGEGVTHVAPGDRVAEGARRQDDDDLLDAVGAQPLELPHDERPAGDGEEADEGVERGGGMDDGTHEGLLDGKGGRAQ